MPYAGTYDPKIDLHKVEGKKYSAFAEGRRFQDYPYAFPVRLSFLTAFFSLVLMMRGGCCLTLLERRTSPLASALALAWAAMRRRVSSIADRDVLLMLLG